MRIYVLKIGLLFFKQNVIIIFNYSVFSSPQTLKIGTVLCAALHSMINVDLITGFQNKLYASILFLNVDHEYIFLFGHPCRFAMH